MKKLYVTRKEYKKISKIIAVWESDALSTCDFLNFRIDGECWGVIAEEGGVAVETRVAIEVENIMEYFTIKSKKKHPEFFTKKNKRRVRQAVKDIIDSCCDEIERGPSWEDATFWGDIHPGRPPKPLV